MTEMSDEHRQTMKALVQEGRGSADVLHLRDVPRPELREGRVIVRMRAASVNALDWHSTHGGLLIDIAAKIMRSKDAPVRGVDLAGVVEEVGPGVTAFKPGDEVFGSAIATFAEYVSAREDRLLGADEVVDHTKEDFARRPQRYDAVIDISATRSVSALRRVLVPDGMFVAVGAAKHGGLVGILARLVAVMVRARLGQRVKFFVARTVPEDLEYLRDLIQAGKLRPVVERTYSLSEGREAVRYVGTGQARAKVVITA